MVEVTKGAGRQDKHGNQSRNGGEGDLKKHKELEGSHKLCCPRSEYQRRRETKKTTIILVK